MDNKSVGEKAREYANAYFPEQEYIDKYMLGKKSGYIRGFIQGSEWRINSVWHGADEYPTKNSMVLVIMSYDVPTVLGPDNTFFKEEVKDRGISRWAYVEDLLPKGGIG